MRDARDVATSTLRARHATTRSSAQMMDELARGCACASAAMRRLRVVVLAAEGESFCAGGDLGWMKQQFERDRTGRLAEARWLARDAARARRSAEVL